MQTDYYKLYKKCWSGGSAFFELLDSDRILKKDLGPDVKLKVCMWISKNPFIGNLIQIRIISRSWIQIGIRVKSWIRIRTKVPIQKL